MVLEIKMTRQISDSIPAFYAADAGAEMCLYYARRGGIGNSCFDVGTSITQAVDPAGAMGNGSTYSANRYSDTEIDSTGGFLQTNRSVEVYW